MPTLDRDRQRVYDAEDSVNAVLKRGGKIEHFGSTLIAPAERFFGRVEDIQAYCDAVLSYGPVRERFPRASEPVTVRRRKGASRGHYEPLGAIIAIPDASSVAKNQHGTKTGSEFAMRETYVLHELAHHLDSRDGDGAAHGSSFTQTLVDLYGLVIGAEAAHLLRVAYSTSGIAVGNDPGAATTEEQIARAGKDEATLLDKISKILHQAENASTEAEADTYFKHAQMLATRYSIDLAVARQHTAKKTKRETPEMRTLRVGSARKRGNTQMVKLFGAIALNNDLRYDIARDSTYVYPYGFPSDIDVAEALFAHLSVQMVSAAGEYLKRGEHLAEVRTRLVKKQKWVPLHRCYDCATCTPRDADGAARPYAGCEDCTVCNAEYACQGENWATGWECGKEVYRNGHGWGHYDRTEAYEEKAPSGQTARLAFYEAFIERIESRLSEARRAAEEAAEQAREEEKQRLIEERDFLRTGADFGEINAEEKKRLAELEKILAEDDSSSSTALVLAAKRDEVADFYKGTSNATGSWKGGRKRTDNVRSARAAGDAAGRAARLSGTAALPSGPKAVR